MDQRARDILKQGDTLFSAKAPWNSLCQGLAEICYTMRADFTQTLNLGDEFATGLMDSTTTNNRETLGNTLESMLRQGDWFKVGTGDRERDGKPANNRALEGATNTLRRIVRDRRTGFDTAMKELDMDWVTFGSPLLHWDIDSTFSHFVLKPHHPRDGAWCYRDGGELDIMFRKVEATAKEILYKIDRKKWNGTVSSEIRRAAEKDPYKKFQIYHVVMWSEDYDEADRYIGKKPYVSMYVDREHETVLHEAGARTFAYKAPRWRRLGGWNQGFSPVAINTLGDMRMLQSIALTILDQAEKSIDPPMIGDTTIFTRDVNLYTGGFTGVDLPEAARLQDKFATINTADNFGPALEVKKDVRELLSAGWLLNKLYLPEIRDMREIEVMTRNEDFRRAVLPFFSPLELEYHSQILGGLFEMCIEFDVINPNSFPPELQGEEVAFTFESPIKEVEGRKEVESFFSMVQIAGAGAEIDQQVTGMFDFAQGAQDAVRGAGGGKWIKTEREVKNEKDEKAALDRLRKGAAVANAGAETVANLSQATIAAQQAGLA